jgi:hypothetical protein
MSIDPTAPYESFVKLQAALTNPPKTKEVATGKFSYWYADLADVIDHIRQPMLNHGFAFSQGPMVDPAMGSLYQTKLYYRGGLFCVVEERMPEFRDPKERGSFTTYTRRYQLLGILGLTGDDDTDGTPPTQERKETRPAAPPRPAVTPKAAQVLPGPKTQPAATQTRPAYILALIDSAKAAKLKKADLEQLIGLRYPDIESVDKLSQAQCATLVSDILKIIPPAASPNPAPSHQGAVGG